MVDDRRSSAKKDSETAVIASGSSSTVDVLSLENEETLSPEYIKIGYAGGATTATAVELYDEDTGTTSANVSDDVERFLLEASETIVVDDPTLNDFEDGVVALADGNQDGEIQVTVGGFKVTG